MQRLSTAALCLILAVIVLRCSRNGPPNSLFESSGFHVRDGKVYYLNAFPGRQLQGSRRDLRVDRSHAYIDGVVFPDADAAYFELLNRAGFADGQLARDSRVVFWGAGSVLSKDPTNFATASDVDGNSLLDADSATCQVLQGAYALFAS